MQKMKIAHQSNYNVLIPLNQERSLAYNTRTQVFALWSKEDMETYALLKKEAIDIRDIRIQDFLRGGYVVSEDVDEKSLIKAEYDKRRNQKGSLSLTILPTTSCNFGCDYCTQGLDKPHIKMLPEVQDAIVDLVKSKASEISYLAINWFGGEPLLEPKIITSLSDRIIEICQRNNIRFSSQMISNGWFLTPEIAKELHQKQVQSIQITLDGSEDFHDQRRHLLGGKPTFERILQNIKAVVENTPIRITIRVNIDQRNSKGIFALMDRLAEEKLNGLRNLGVYFAPVESRTEECHGVCEATIHKKQYGDLEVELYRYAYEKKLVPLPQVPKFMGICTALKADDMVILPNGDLHKCWETVADPKKRVGSIFNLERFADDTRHQKWLNWSPFEEKTCSQCQLLPTCAGACAQKYLNPESLKGEAALPCPSWKYNLHEKLFFRAEQRGIVSRERDWDEEISPTQPHKLTALVKRESLIHAI